MSLEKKLSKGQFAAAALIALSGALAISSPFEYLYKHFITMNEYKESLNYQTLNNTNNSLIYTNR